jgi:5-formyltetrahydrofolate cyclo-ligase
MSPQPYRLERDTLRRELRARRRAMPAAARIAAAESLAQRLLSLPFAPRQGFVAGYWAMDGEIALHAWQLRLPKDCTYCLPVLHADERLRFAPWRPGDPLVSNRHGIPEPEVAPSALVPAEEMTFVVAPLVGFDATGHRLGMGGGWYDRSFAFRNGRTAPPHLVGAAFAAQQVESVFPQAWDMPLDALCTDRDALIFGPGHAP